MSRGPCGRAVLPGALPAHVLRMRRIDNVGRREERYLRRLAVCARGRSSLAHQQHLDGLHAPARTRRACGGAVLRPRHPASVLHVRLDPRLRAVYKGLAVGGGEVAIGGVGGVRCADSQQAQLERLETQPLARRAHQAGARPGEPAVVPHVRARPQLPALREVRPLAKPDLERLDALAGACGADGVAAGGPACVPAGSLHVRAVLHVRI